MAAQRRLQVAAFVAANPGCSQRAIARGTQIPLPSLAVYLQPMIRRREIHVVESPAQDLHFPGGTVVPDVRRALALAKPELKKLYEWLLANAALMPESQVRIAKEALRLWGWPESSTRQRLRRLQSAGLIGITASTRQVVLVVRTRSTVAQRTLD